jgi:phosphopantetheinyl transferase
MEYLETGFLAFPIRLKELHLYGPNHRPFERLRCQVRIRQVTSKQISADIDIIGPDERIWARLIGWEDWRFYLAPQLFSFWRDPKSLTLSVPWNTPISKFPAPGSFECYRLDRFEPDQIVLKELWVHLILNRAEREAWRNLRKPEAKKTEWLIGRWVAKDAVRMFLKKHYGMELYPADIEIASDEHGRPVPQGGWTQDIEIVPALSLTHTDGIAVAVAGHCSDSQRVGIDIERIRPRKDGFEKLAFKKEEQALLSQLSESARQEWITRFWCTKEAVGKALGRGLIEGPKSMVVQELNVQSGIVKVALQGKLAKEFPEFSHTQIVAYTAKEEDHIIASSLCEEGNINN